jgi:hypothetical protein
MVTRLEELYSGLYVMSDGVTGSGSLQRRPTWSRIAVMSAGLIAQ